MPHYYSPERWQTVKYGSQNVLQRIPTQQCLMCGKYEMVEQAIVHSCLSCGDLLDKEPKLTNPARRRVYEAF